MLYSRSITIVEDKIVEPNLAIRILNNISSIILYPASSIAIIIVRLLSVCLNFNPYGVTEDSTFLFFIFLPIVVIEGYLISCIISIFVKRFKK